MAQLTYNLPNDIPEEFGIRLCCPLGCNKGFRSIRRTVEHIRYYHNPDSNLKNRITEDELDQISKVVQKLRLRPCEEKACAMYDILQQYGSQHIYQLQYSVILETAEALQRGEPGSDEAFKDIRSRIAQDPQLADHPPSEEQMRMLCRFIKPFILSLSQGGHFVCPPDPKNVSKANQEVQQMTTLAPRTESLPQPQGNVPVGVIGAHTELQMDDFIQTDTSTRVASSGIPLMTEESIIVSAVDTENIGSSSHGIGLMGDDFLGQQSGSQDHASSTLDQWRTPQLSFDPFSRFSVLVNEQVNPPYEPDIQFDSFAPNYQGP